MHSWRRIESIGFALPVQIELGEGRGKGELIDMAPRAPGKWTRNFITAPIHYNGFS